MKLLCTILLSFGLAAGLVAQDAPAVEEHRGQFRAVDIYLDAGSTPLAAYQLEFTITNQVAKIAGIEGGEHPAFRTPPHYDPKAMQQERVIIAAFNAGKSSDLPTGRVRVATIHLLITGAEEPGYSLKVQTAADGRARTITVKANWQERKAP
jgi:hypothetical protein